MRLLEIRDIFIAEYKRECIKRKETYTDVDSKLIAFDISEAQQNIQRRIKVVEKNYSISLSPGVNTYQLPSDFGNQKILTINDYLIKEKSLQDIQTAQARGGDQAWFAVLPSGNSQYLMVYPTPTGSESAILYYYPDFNYYSPSGSTDQNWGSFDGSAFSGYMKLPERYVRAIVLYMLSKWFDDFTPKYEIELSRLNGQRVSSYDDTMRYNIGWEQETNVSAGGSYVTINENSSYSKVFRFTMVEGEQPVVVKTEGFTGSVSAVEAGGVITITSSASEFTQPSTFLKLEPSDMNYTIDANQIQITTYTGHEPITGEVQIW